MILKELSLNVRLMTTLRDSSFFYLFNFIFILIPVLISITLLTPRLKQTETHATPRSPRHLEPYFNPSQPLLSLSQLRSTNPTVTYDLLQPQPNNRNHPLRISHNRADHHPQRIQHHGNRQRRNGRLQHSHLCRGGKVYKSGTDRKLPYSNVIQ